MPDEPKRQPWQFSIRDVLLIMLIVGLAVGWFVDHRRLADELERQRNQNNIVWLGNAASGYSNTLHFLTGTTGSVSPAPADPLQPDETITDPPPEKSVP